MILYIGKAKDLTWKHLLWVAYFQLARPLEPLEAVDFSKN
uniref:Uncharacterized protein n=1 Tax=viral metagenome TaxID=1070528 RepID=A0A6M3JHZ5_9ZZZZ